MDQEAMLADIWTLMQPRVSDADRAAIWGRYCETLKARVAAKAEANGWQSDGKGWVKVG